VAEEEEVALPEDMMPPALFITIRFDEDNELEVNIGDLPYFHARGMLEAAIQEIQDCQPPVSLMSTEAVYYATHGRWIEVEDDEDEETEE
jgi:hypothetical protein